MKANELTELELVRAEQICRLNHQLLYLMAVYAKQARDIDHVVGRLHIGHEQITHIALSRQVDRNTAKADHFSLWTIVHHPSAPHHQPIALRPAPSHPRRRRPHAPPNRAHPRPTTRTPALTSDRRTPTPPALPPPETQLGLVARMWPQALMNVCKEISMQLLQDRRHANRVPFVGDRCTLPAGDEGQPVGLQFVGALHQAVQLPFACLGRG